MPKASPRGLFSPAASTVTFDASACVLDATSIIEIAVTAAAARRKTLDLVGSRISSSPLSKSLPVCKPAVAMARQIERPTSGPDSIDHLSHEAPPTSPHG